MAIFASTAAAEATRVDLHFFWSADCPHCRDMAASVRTLQERDPQITVRAYEVARNEANAELFRRVSEAYALPPAVPIVLIGDAVLVGHSDGTDAELTEMVASCRAGPCPDLVSPLTTGVRAEAPPPAPTRQRMPARIDLPFLGEVDPKSLSLPVLTIAMAAVDGFNPCAMWVLVFLIGLLLGIRDRRRMWTLALTFLVTTAIMYFVVLAAWLNVLLLLGALAWLRAALGVLAIGAGGVYLREGLKREQACPVTEPEKRRRIFDRLRALVHEPNLWVSMSGIALLAVAVNFVELLCSAGIPAVFTGVLAQAELPAAQYHAYLLLYILVFLADDAAVVVAAMTTLRFAGVERGYARPARILGGALMIGLGLLLVFKPDWLDFAV